MRLPRVSLRHLLGIVASSAIGLTCLLYASSEGSGAAFSVTRSFLIWRSGLASAAATVCQP